MKTTLFRVMLACLVILPAARFAAAGELEKEAAPHKWIERFMPEKLPELKFPAYYDDLDKARAMAFAGRYKAALMALGKVKKGKPEEIALVRATALSAIGQREKAVSTLSVPDVKDNPRVEVLRARILAELGRQPEAIALLKGHIQKHAASVPARYYLAEICETVGDLATARQQYDWIHKTFWDPWQGQGAKQFEDAEQVTLLGRAFDRWAILNNQYAGNAALHNLMLKAFVQAYDVIDRGYWPAHVAAAEFYVSHGNAKEAGKELKAALAGNPNDIRSHLLLGLIALESFNFDAADKVIAAIRAVDSDSLDADLLEARSLLQQRRPVDAERPANRVLARQPNHIEAMSLLASAYALQLKEDKVAELIARVEKIDPRNPLVYFELGEQLAAMRQYPRSEKMYEVAIERAPWMSSARNGLGLLLTQSGDEEKAKKVLDAAYALDPFNYRTANYLILLERMGKMARRESAHFVIIYDAAEDPLAGEYFTEYLESIHKELCDLFAHEPNVKTYIEVFPDHESFSARITGSPWIGTVGASTGRVIAIATPRKASSLGTYNWAQVLRHEYTHTVTLAATENRITHWMTEGLAVAEERVPVRFEWAPMLYNAVTKKQLFDMDALTWAFVRPKRPQDRSLAYAQSWWVCQYIEGKWGRPTILKMMEQFKAGKTQDEVFPVLLGITTKAFSQEFFAWAEKQVKGWGYDAETTKKFNEVSKKAEEKMKARDFAGALADWEQAAKLRPMDAAPMQRLAGLYLSKQINQPEKALQYLDRLHVLALKDNRFAKRIAGLYVGRNDFKKAERYALEAVYIDPYDLGAHELLLEACEKSGNQVGADREARVIPKLTEWMEKQKKRDEGEEEKKAEN